MSTVKKEVEKIAYSKEGWSWRSTSMMNRDRPENHNKEMGGGGGGGGFLAQGSGLMVFCFFDDEFDVDPFPGMDDEHWGPLEIPPNGNGESIIQINLNMGIDKKTLTKIREGEWKGRHREGEGEG
ncbi:hypothetical protein ACJX0J_013502, partial [Zea mays]